MRARLVAKLTANRSICEPERTHLGVRANRIERHLTVALCAAALGLFAPSLAALGAPPEARAADVPFNCGVLEVGHWCLQNTRHSYYASTAEYYGNYVCTKLIRDLNGAFLGQACGRNFAYLSITRVYLSRGLVYNGGPSRHTIFGHAYY